MGPKHFTNNHHRVKEMSPEIQTTTTEGIDEEGQGCSSRRCLSVIKVDSDGASCEDVVCHVNSLLLLLLLRRAAGPSPAALGTA